MRITTPSDQQKKKTTNMAQSLVTQVARPGTAAASTTDESTAVRGARWKFFSSLFCCVCPGVRTLEKKQAATDATWWQPTHPDPGNNLIPPQDKALVGRKLLVLDLDETLVHSSFKPVANADFVVPIEIEDRTHNVYVCKRPYVDMFLERLGAHYEIVIFTASLSKYADPVSDLLDPKKLIKHRLFREHCVFHRGNYVKDLSRLGRSLKDTIIVDNSPASYVFQPENAVPVESWFDDPTDTELLDLIPFFEELSKVDDVTVALKMS